MRIVSDVGRPETAISGRPKGQGLKRKQYASENPDCQGVYRILKPWEETPKDGVFFFRRKTQERVVKVKRKRLRAV